MGAGSGRDYISRPAQPPPKEQVEAGRTAANAATTDSNNGAESLPGMTSTPSPTAAASCWPPSSSPPASDIEEHPSPPGATRLGQSRFGREELVHGRPKNGAADVVRGGGH